MCCWPGQIGSKNKRKMALLMTEIVVGRSQGAHLVQQSLTGVSSKGEAVPSSALELRHFEYFCDT